MSDMEIRDTGWDIGNFSLVCGIIILNWLTFFAYLMVRTLKRKEKRAAGKVPSKADRPFYVAGLVFAATNWLLGTLYATGTVATMEKTEYLPAVMIYFVQYIGGALLWIWLTIDRMLSRYALVRFAGEGKVHKGYLLRLVSGLVAFVPFVVLAIVAVAMDKVEVNGLGVTDQDDTFEVIMVVYHGLLLFGILFLIFKIRKIIGNFHELIRYTIFLALTLCFFLYDALTTLVHPLQKSVVAQQLMVLLVWLITTSSLYWIFILAMKPRKAAVKTPDEQEPVLKTVMEDSEAINHFIDQDSAGANVAEGGSEMIFTSTKDMLWYIPVRRRLTEAKPRPFAEFLKQVPDKDLAEEVDRDSGLFRHASKAPEFRFKPTVGYLTALKM